MSSLPGMPGSLGLSSGNPTGFPSGNSDASFDVPSGVAAPITVVNRTYAYPGADFSHIYDLSGSFSIPATTPGNLLVVFATPTLSGVLTCFGSISDNVGGDVFTQVPWYSIAGSNATAGQMANFNVGGYSSGDVGQYDAWYTVSAGGATVINWNYTDSDGDAEVPEFWVYELTGPLSWTLIASGATYGLQSVPYLGPSLNGTAPDNAYFAFIGSGEGFEGDGVVDLPWLLDPDYQTYAYGQSLAYIVDSTDIQQASFSTGDTPDIFVSCGVVFGPSGYGPPPPPPPPSGGTQPNVCIVC